MKHIVELHEDRWQAVRAGTPAYDLGLKLLRDAIESAREVAR